MNRAIEVTIQGTVATAPVLTRQEGKKPYCRFRVAASYGQMVSGSWVNYDTLWFTAKAWADLAEHLAQSFKRGDPVILCGRLGEEHWMRSGQRVSSMVLHLHCAGHDLTRGEAHYTKVVIIHDKADAPGEAQRAAQRTGQAQTMSTPQTMSCPETMSGPEVISGPEAANAPETMSGSEAGLDLGSAMAAQNGEAELVTPSLEAQDQWSTDYTLV